jgi:ribosomal protein L44E
MDPATFFPDALSGAYRPDRYSPGERRALLVCGRCPVLQECLELALSYPDQAGIAGGMTATERRKARTQRGHQPAPRKPPECGTDRGYVQHRRLNTPACSACKAAHAAADAARYQRRQQQRGAA